jgi:Uma2 family endonuclease
MRALHRALDNRLKDGPCQPLGPDVGVATIDTAVRYPDALVTCAPLQGLGQSLTVPGAVVIFEIVSPGSGRTDRIVKPREYAAIPSLRGYCIIESTSVGLTVLQRRGEAETWRAGTLLNLRDVLDIPEIGIQIPVSELYDGVAFDDETLTS